MTDKEAIKYLKQIYPNGGGSWLDEQRLEAINMAIDALRQKSQRVMATFDAEVVDGAVIVEKLIMTKFLDQEHLNAGDKIKMIIIKED